MSINDSRSGPAYRWSKVEVCHAANGHILAWWTPEHDAAIARRIAQLQWLWPCGVHEDLVRLTPTPVLKQWKASDPECARHAWYNVLTTFAEAHATTHALTQGIRRPVRRMCPLCSQEFDEDSLPYPLAVRLGIDRLEFCAPCLSEPIFGDGSKDASRENILQYLRDIAKAAERVPHQGFGGFKTDLLGLSFEARVQTLKLLRAKPSNKRVKQVFGSWLHALVEAGVLSDGSRKTARGIQTLARDGHLCLSLAERTIDDLLYSLGIGHDKEPRYPEGGFRADFLVRGVFIEYFGLAGNAEYDARRAEKARICYRHGVELIELFPSDLASLPRLRSKLAVFLPAEGTVLAE